MYRYAALVVVGYEYHDDYVTTGEWMFDIESDELYSFSLVDEYLSDLLLGGGYDEDGFSRSMVGEDGWMRLECIERVH